MKVGVVGVGTMGYLVVQMLLENEERVFVSDPNAAALQRAQALGASPTSSPAALAVETDLIMMLLPGPPQVEAVVAGENGLLSAAGKGSIIIDMSTVDPATTRRLGRRAESGGVGYLDAPILGRPSAVGRWVLPVGGEAHTLERCRPILEILARKIVHVGPLGAGNTLKLLNALMFSAINAMTAEMLAISAKAGLEPQILYDTVAGSEAATVSGLFKEVGRKIVERDFDPAFSIELLCKDNGLAIEMAKSFDAPPILASTIQTLNELARARGLGQQDTSALVKLYEELLDVKATDT